MVDTPMNRKTIDQRLRIQDKEQLNINNDCLYFERKKRFLDFFKKSQWQNYKTENEVHDDITIKVLERRIENRDQRIKVLEENIFRQKSTIEKLAGQVDKLEEDNSSIEQKSSVFDKIDLD